MEWFSQLRWKRTGARGEKERSLFFIRHVRNVWAVLVGWARVIDRYDLFCTYT
jgi:hypothetical protein